ncbi:MULTISPECIES: YgdI/YgdR family lipoprotein [Stutzerimonas]|jgi:major membrane immunogen (membrane-anchored lipoprotein)|uniref:Lipoprotein YgdI/YgdR-like SH3-like domain-containing protein n=2 Tax=Stutzerimonas balearica DSM 6083 TaxID=1123016 RepID=A0ABY0R8P3_9GAMM|nr:YgdI/YgdR family lipoprotein [Stutzerimonas balearica]KIL03353.1 lipoprotein [Stutzerimonas stutzeri]MBB60898.1 YgdI/YgdR family lipoprotein [Pseudomonas sp.]MBZ5754189.1 YgdI/YgdR family lipoprotein [Pseudomonas sp. S5(2021)]WIX02683.1 YgdI/YgdR family lipoprotein [Pseudomonas sp. AR5]MBD3737987.1 YgdI/YgdR family lipoprotein [Stutzerimonas balearica]|tara:strand:- start:415 stop:636 length:222 start_codon:yes stop_codon:yes gene_type:complete
MFRTFSFAMLALGMALLGGCASPSQITLTDGRQMQSLDTPEYDEDTGFYEFEQADGRRIRVNRDQVQSIQTLD